MAKQDNEIKLTDKPLTWEQAVGTAFQIAERSNPNNHRFAVRKEGNYWTVNLVLE